jgi:hypothetical protein
MLNAENLEKFVERLDEIVDLTTNPKQKEILHHIAYAVSQIGLGEDCFSEYKKAFSDITSTPISYSQKPSELKIKILDAHVYANCIDDQISSYYMLAYNAAYNTIFASDLELERIYEKFQTHLSIIEDVYGVSQGTF